MGLIGKFRERKLSDRMKKEAVGLGLCAQWTAEWGKDTTKRDMAEKFVTGLDFCIQHDWPSTEVIKRDFGDVMHEYGVYVDENVHLTDPKTMVLNGRCEAHIYCGRFAASNIYVRHKSTAQVTVARGAYVHVSAYDKADVEIICEPGAKCFVYKYGGKVKTAGEGRVTVREREHAPGVDAKTADMEMSPHKDNTQNING